MAKTEPTPGNVATQPLPPATRPITPRIAGAPLVGTVQPVQTGPGFTEPHVMPPRPSEKGVDEIPDPIVPKVMGGVLFVNDKGPQTLTEGAGGGAFDPARPENQAPVRREEAPPKREEFKREDR